MANTLNNITDVGTAISKIAVATLKDNLQFCKTIAKESESSFTANINGYKPGDTINVSKPARFISTSSNLDITSNISNITEEKVSMQLNNTETLGVELTSLEIKTDMDLQQAAQRVIIPAVESIAQKLESNVLDTVSDAIYQTVGTAGSTVFGTSTMLSAKDALNASLCPMGDRYTLLNSVAMSSAVNARKGLFQSSEDIAKQYKQGYVGMADGFNFMENQLLPTHTNGNDVSFEVRTTVSTEGATSLVVEGLTTTTGTVTKGTTFTIATVNSVHPITKADTGNLQEFVVTADVTADGSGYATLSISPAIYTSASAGLQNVTAFPADGDAITVLTGSASTGYTQNLAFHPKAFRFVTVPMHNPRNTEMASVYTEDGLTINVVRDFDVLTRKEIMRFDVLYAIQTVRPEWAVRITA